MYIIGNKKDCVVGNFLGNSKSDWKKKIVEKMKIIKKKRKLK